MRPLGRIQAVKPAHPPPVSPLKISDMSQPLAASQIASSTRPVSPRAARVGGVSRAALEWVGAAEVMDGVRAGLEEYFPDGVRAAPEGHHFPGEGLDFPGKEGLGPRRHVHRRMSSSIDPPAGILVDT